jgi:hypothetical protein
VGERCHRGKIGSFPSRHRHAAGRAPVAQAWDGTTLRFAIEPPGSGEGVAVLVQASDNHMLGVAMVLGSG